MDVLYPFLLPFYSIRLPGSHFETMLECLYPHLNNHTIIKYLLCSYTFSH